MVEFQKRESPIAAKRARGEVELLENIQRGLPELQALLSEISSDLVYEDLIYRFYHQSLKVYWLQDQTTKIVDALRGVAPRDSQLSPYFEEIVSAGASGKAFEVSHNKDWTTHTRPIVEAFFHAQYFLEMVVKYGQELSRPQELLPSGWAAVLELYGIR